jgi:hypothetical protein
MLQIVYLSPIRISKYRIETNELKLLGLRINITPINQF